MRLLGYTIWDKYMPYWKKGAIIGAFLFGIGTIFNYYIPAVFPHIAIPLTSLTYSIIPITGLTSLILDTIGAMIFGGLLIGTLSWLYLNRDRLKSTKGIGAIFLALLLIFLTPLNPLSPFAGMTICAIYSDGNKLYIEGYNPELDPNFLGYVSQGSRICAGGIRRVCSNGDWNVEYLGNSLWYCGQYSPMCDNFPSIANKWCYHSQYWSPELGCYGYDSEMRDCPLTYNTNSGMTIVRQDGSQYRLGNIDPKSISIPMIQYNLLEWDYIGQTLKPSYPRTWNMEGVQCMANCKSQDYDYGSCLLVPCKDYDNVNNKCKEYYPPGGGYYWGAIINTQGNFECVWAPCWCGNFVIKAEIPTTTTTTTTPITTTTTPTTTTTTPITTTTTPTTTTTTTTTPQDTCNQNCKIYGYTSGICSQFPTGNYHLLGTFCPSGLECWCSSGTTTTTIITTTTIPLTCIPGQPCYLPDGKIGICKQGYYAAISYCAPKEPPEEPNYLLYGVGVIIILIGIVGYLFIIKKKRK